MEKLLVSGKRGLKVLVKHLPLPMALKRLVYRKGREGAPPVGLVQFGSFRRVTPLSTLFGYDRGQPVDRFYVERFLARHSAEIAGRVLEVKDATYTRQFGGDRVVRSDVVDIAEAAGAQATIIADLTAADHIPSDAFDCIVFTQTLQFIYDARAALRTLHRVLKPGGVLLLTVPGITPVDQGEEGDSWYWFFTAASARRLMAECFTPGSAEVRAHGNVLSASAFLFGLAAEELRTEELEHSDPAYQFLITVRAVKAPA